MARSRTEAVQQELLLDMTPMIDCVFLLMIFFVLVIDISQQEMEDLILPKAVYAQPDEDPPDTRPIININQKGQVIYRRNVWYDPDKDGDNFDNLKKLLVWFKDNTVKKESVKTEQIGPHKMTVIDDPILIRADKWTEWHYVGKFMQGCVNPNAAFWKLELGMSEQDKEERLFKYRKQ